MERPDLDYLAAHCPLRPGELDWLARQHSPVWSGPFERGDEPNDPAILNAERMGIIARCGQPAKGYLLTRKGREAERLNAAQEASEE